MRLAAAAVPAAQNAFEEPSMFNKEASFFNALRKPPSDDLPVFMGMSTARRGPPRLDTRSRLNKTGRRPPASSMGP